MDALTAEYSALLREWMEIGAAMSMTELQRHLSELRVEQADSAVTNDSQVIRLPAIRSHLSRGEHHGARRWVAPRRL